MGCSYFKILHYEQGAGRRVSQHTHGFTFTVKNELFVESRLSNVMDLPHFPDM